PPGRCCGDGSWDQHREGRTESGLEVRYARALFDLHVQIRHARGIQMRMIVLFALGAPLFTLQAQGPRPFTPADWYRVTTLSAPALSPDGRTVAFTVTTVK